MVEATSDQTLQRSVLQCLRGAGEQDFLEVFGVLKLAAIEQFDDSWCEVRSLQCDFACEVRVTLDPVLTAAVSGEGFLPAAVFHLDQSVLLFRREIVRYPLKLLAMNSAAKPECVQPRARA